LFLKKLQPIWYLVFLFIFIALEPLPWRQGFCKQAVNLKEFLSARGIALAVRLFIIHEKIGSAKRQTRPYGELCFCVPVTFLMSSRNFLPRCMPSIHSCATLKRRTSDCSQFREMLFSLLQCLLGFVMFFRAQQRRTAFW